MYSKKQLITKILLVLSIISFIIPYGVYALDLIFVTGYNSITAVFLFLISSVIAFPSLILLILNIISLTKKQNKKGSIISELVFACINILLAICYGFSNKGTLPTKIGFIIFVVVSVVMAIGYIVKLIKKKY